ncbi:MAG: flagellar assembly protein FliW [Cryobacterium sp.]|nr:flagellar assembly protein FliW [Oligoflexia bacterium]
MIVETGRFGTLEVAEADLVSIPGGILGFPEYTKFCLIDPNDDVLIIWLQSLEKPDLAIPVLEPKIFKNDYTVRLSAAELRELRLDNVNQSAVFSLLTIGDDITQMTANLKAPLVINLREHVAKQVVLQENEYTLKHPMFKELRAHLMTIASQRPGSSARDEAPRASSVISVDTIPPSLTVKTLQA